MEVRRSEKCFNVSSWKRLCKYFWYRNPDLFLQKTITDFTDTCGKCVILWKTDTSPLNK